MLRRLEIFAILLYGFTDLSIAAMTFDGIETWGCQLVSTTANELRTCKNGLQTGKDQMVTEIRKLCVAYELFVVVRLCTAEQNVVDYYNKVDEEVEFSLDVLCNLEAEAREIKAVSS